jgi:hypothetical protein
MAQRLQGVCNEHQCLVGLHGTHGHTLDQEVAIKQDHSSVFSRQKPQDLASLALIERQLRAMVDFRTLLLKYKALLAENQALKEENLILKDRLGLAETSEGRSYPQGVQQDVSRAGTSFHLYAKSDPTEKIRLLMSLFKGQQRSFAALDERVVEAHLRGQLVPSIYPLRQDEWCHFLAIDFDKDAWQQDVSTLREVCKAFDVPVAIERSRAGHGAHT